MRLLRTALVALVGLGLFAACSAPRVDPQNEPAWELFEEARSGVISALEAEGHSEYVGLDDLGIKPPAGLVLYARGMDADHGEGGDPDIRYVVAVLDLAAGVIFAEQYPRGAGVQRFDTLEDYDAWDWQEHAIGLPDIRSFGAAYAEQLDVVQRAYYEEHGVFAQSAELVEFSVTARAPIPDVTPAEGYIVAANADRLGYFTTVVSPHTDRVHVVAGYGPGDDVYVMGSWIWEELLAYDGGSSYPALTRDRWWPLKFIAVEPGDLDEDDEVLVVDIPDPFTGVAGS